MRKLIIVAGLHFFSIMAHSEIVFNWGIDSELYYFSKQAEVFKKTIESKLAGKVKINIKTYKDVTKERSPEEYFKSDEYQIFQSLAGNFVKTEPKLKVWEVPFLFVNDHQVEKYIVSKNGQALLGKLETAVTLPIDYAFSGGFIFMYSPQPINSLADLIGNKVYLSKAFGLGEEFLKPLGIKYQEIVDRPVQDGAYGELLGAGLPDVVANESIKGLTVNLTNHRVTTRVLFASKKALELLNEVDRKVFVKELRKMAVKERVDSIVGKNLGIALFENRGLRLNRWTPEIIVTQRHLFDAQYAEYRKAIGSEMDYVDSLLAKSRQVSSLSKNQTTN